MGAKVEKVTPNKFLPSVEEAIDEEMEMKEKKYMRGEAANLENLQDKKLKGQLEVREELYGKSAKAAAKAEKYLMPSESGYLEAEGIEKTYRIKQESIAREVDILSSRNQYDIVLPDLGPYTLNYTPSGRYMALAGRKGHLAILDMKNMSLIKEIQVRETVRDVAFLHNEMFFAAAQKKYTYIYNRDGTELHCLKEHGSVTKLQFLKNHFLLSSINKFGQLHYQDVTTGQMVNTFKTGHGRSDTIRVNPYNNVLSVGHSRGTVTMWKPTTAAPLVKMLCHSGPVTSISFHPNGHLMATSGIEKKVKIWDLRKFQVVDTLHCHASTLDYSQKGLLAAGSGSFIRVFDGTKQYMTHAVAKGYQVMNILYRPYEDVLGIGHSMGWSSILIPGSGEANFDTWVANPFETGKQRKEKEVKALLDKLPPETIMMDPSKIGTVKGSKKEKKMKEEIEKEKEEAIEKAKGSLVKKKTKGRSKPSKVARKKEEAVENVKKKFLDLDGGKKRKRGSEKDGDDLVLPKSLQRFAKKKVT